MLSCYSPITYEIKKMKRLSLIALVLSATLSATAQTARLQVIHNSPDAAAASVDVYANGAELLQDFSFRTATPFIDVPADVDIAIAIAPGNSMSAADAVFTQTINLTADETYVAVASGIVSPTGYTPTQVFGLSVYAMAQEAAATTGTTDVLIFHGATDAPTVDVTLPGGSPTLVDNLAYNTFAAEGYLQLPTNDYTVEVRDASGMNVVAAYDAPLATLGLQDAALVVLASGFLDPSMNSNGPAFGLYAALPSGGDLVALPLATPDPTARVQVIHNSADAVATVVDVYANGSLLIPDFAFRTATPFVDVPAGVDIVLAIAPGNSMSAADAVYTQTVNLMANETYIVVANGIVSPSGYTPSVPFNLHVYAMAREAASVTTNTDVLVYHGVTDAPTVDITLTDGTTLVDNVSYSEFASNGYLELPTMDYNIQVRDAPGTNVVAAYAAPLATLGLQGNALVVLASGFLSPSSNSNGPAFGLFAAPAAGGNLVELPLFTGLFNAANNNSSFSVYPNPSNGLLYLTQTAVTNGNVNVIDATGRVMMTQEINNERTAMDISMLADGFYMVQLIADNGLVSSTALNVSNR